MKNLIIVVFLLFFNFQKKDNTIYNKIGICLFNVNNQYTFNYNLNLKIIENSNAKTFIYTNKTFKEVIKIEKTGKVYLDGVLLEKIDSIEVKLKNTTKTVIKYSFDSHSFNSAFYFVNKDYGIIFAEGLSTGKMMGYNYKLFSDIHYLIAIRKIKFKTGSSELKFGIINYPSSSKAVIDQSKRKRLNIAKIDY